MDNGSARVCSIEGCERPFSGHGLCQMHLKRLHKYGDPLVRQRAEKGANLTCTAEGCDRPFHAHGYCSMHLKRLSKYGNLEGRPTCAIEGCEKRPNLGRDLCRHHFDHPRVLEYACQNVECGRLCTRERKPGRPSCYCSDECRSRAAVLRMIAWEEANPERAKELRKAILARYGALKRGATPPGELFTLDEIYERDGGICYLCGGAVTRKDRSMDHVIPVSKGGMHARSNVRLAHRRCNSRKNARLLAAQ